MLDGAVALRATEFELPDELVALEPPEARGLRRDQVRLLVSHLPDPRAVTHRSFDELPQLLSPGDVLVVNVSKTIPASLPVRDDDGIALELHLSTHLPADLWIVELRAPGPAGSKPYPDARGGTPYALPSGGRARLLAPYSQDRRSSVSGRLWVATLELPEPLDDYLGRHGAPITYSGRRFAMPVYQTVFATEPGSAEMPSAGRPFSGEVVAALAARGIEVLPVVLHTGVSSPEAHEPPFEEYYRVPDVTARGINSARAHGGRVIAVGTTVVRALETVADERGEVHPAEGWTRLVISSRRPPRAIDGMLTGWHEPRSSHLAMIEAVAGRPALDHAYSEALRSGYLWHEFGDSHLIAPL